MNKAVIGISVFTLLCVSMSLFWLHYSYLILKKIPKFNAVSVVNDDLYVQFGGEVFKGRLDRMYSRESYHHKVTDDAMLVTKRAPIIITSAGQFFYSEIEHHYKRCIDNACLSFKNKESTPQFYDFAANDNGFALLESSSISMYTHELKPVETLSVTSVKGIVSIKSLYKDFYLLSGSEQAIYKIQRKNGESSLERFIDIKESVIEDYEIKQVESFSLFYDRIAVLVTTKFTNHKAIVWYDVFGQFMEAKILDERYKVQQLQTYQDYLLLIDPEAFKIMIMDKSNTIVGLVSWPEIQTLLNDAYEQKLFYERLIPAIMPLSIAIIILGFFLTYKLRTTQVKLDFNYDDPSVRI